MAQNVFAFDLEDKSKSLEADYGDSVKDYWTDLKLAYPANNQITILAGSRCKIGTYFIKFADDETITITSSASQANYYINLDVNFTQKTSTLSQSSTFQAIRDYSGVSKFTILHCMYHGGTFYSKYFEPLYDQVEETQIYLNSAGTKISSTSSVVLSKDLGWFSYLRFEADGHSSPIIKSSATIPTHQLSTNSYTTFTMVNTGSLSATSTYNKFIKQKDSYNLTGGSPNDISGSPLITRIVGVYDPNKKNPKF